MSASDTKEAQLSTALQTDVGMVRDHNEDSAFADPEGRYFIVADGMGGHAAGEVASAMAVDSVRDALESARADLDSYIAAPTPPRRLKLIHALEGAVKKAHQAVFSRGTTESDKHGMGTTLDVALVAGPDVFVAHVGDSRTYLLRDGEIHQVTTDHTYAQVMVAEGKLTAEDAVASPLRTILINALGVAADVHVEMAQIRLNQGDYLLLCSDGLHDYFPLDKELADLILDHDELGDALTGLVELAKERGGQDNITGILVRIDELPDRPVDVDTTHDDASDAVPQGIASDDTRPVEQGDLDTIHDAETDPNLDPISGSARTLELEVPDLDEGETDLRATTPLKKVTGGDDSDSSSS